MPITAVLGGLPIIGHVTQRTKAHRYLALLYVGLVTALLLGLVVESAARGPAAFPGVAVYALGAGFGLEFIRSSWIAEAGPRGDERRLPPWRQRASRSWIPPTRAATFMHMDGRRTDVLRASPRMFESDWLDRLSRVHPAVPPVIFSPVIAVLFALGQEGTHAVEAVAWIFGGYVFWTLTEYWMHRLVFHFEPEEGIGARLHWIIHGVHHDHPNDPMRLVMPPSVSVPLAAIFMGLFVLVLGTPAAYLFGAGFLVGYLAYDMTHYHLHHHKPRTRVGKRLYELHMRHHFQDDTRGFGVSAPFWDYAFQTRHKRTRSAA